MANQPANTPDMLTGDVRAITLKTAMPSLGAMLATGLSTLLDALLLARLGSGVTAAVGVSFPLITLFQTIGFTLGMGAGSFSSRSLGSGETDAPRRAASGALFLALALSLLVLVLGFCFSAPLARLLGANGAIETAAVQYLRWVLLCGPLLCLSLVLSSLLRAQGRVMQNLAAYLVGTTAGSALEWLLVVRLGRGIVGAGVSMLVREGLALLLLIFFTLRSPQSLRPNWRLCLPTLPVLGEIFRFGLPTLVRQGVMSVAGVMQSRTAATFGSAALAGMGLAVRVLALISSAIIGFGQGFQPVCGFNCGAGKTQRVHSAYCFCQKVLCLSLLIIGALLFFFSGPLLALFASDDASAAFGARLLRAQSPVLFAQGAVVMMNMLTQAMGLPLRATLVATSRQGIFYIPLLLLLPRVLGETGLVICQSVSDVLALLFSFLLTRKLFESPQNRVDSR